MEYPADHRFGGLNLFYGLREYISYIYIGNINIGQE